MNTTSISSILRFGGMATGLDTDSIVKQLMQAQRVPLDKLYQKRQLLEWKRSDYRDITNLLRGFKDEFLDVLKPLNNMISSTTYKKFTTTSSDTSLVTATATSDAVAGTHTITATQLAAAANTSSTVSVSKDLTGANVAATDYTGANQFVVSLNGITKTISLRNGDYGTVANLISNGVDGIQDVLNTAFGAGKITVSDAGGGKLNFTTANGRVTIGAASTNNALTQLGFTGTASNRITTSDTLENISLKTGLTFDGSNQLNFTINGVNFTFNKTDTLNNLMSSVNSSSVGVEIRYSELDDKFTITSKQKGSGNSITISNTGGNFFDPVAANSAAKIATGSVSNGQDAVFDLDATIGIVRNDNTFAIDGVTYTLVKTGGAATININQDVDGVYNSIKGFVDKYNEIISKINLKLSEKKYKDFQPLTDEQKKDMKDEDIKVWEEKARSGLLRNDSILQKMTSDMRKAIYDAVQGVSGNLSDIGITTTGNYLDNGKLVIDETKLKNVISTNPDKVQNLFSKKSTIDYSPELTAAQRTQRYNEEGVANRFYDILMDNIRTTRSTSGKKGFLLEKAGIIGDVSDVNNLISSDINRTDNEINNLIERLNARENAYYLKFAALEKYVSQMNSQSSWLAQQFSGGQ